MSRERVNKHEQPAVLVLFRNVRPHVLRYGSFLLLFFTINAAIAPVLSFHFLDYTGGFRVDREYDESRDSIEYLVFGDSHACCAINEQEFPEAGSLATLGESPPIAYYKLLHVLRHRPKRLKAVILQYDWHIISPYRLGEQFETAYAGRHLDYLDLARREGQCFERFSDYVSYRLIPYAGLPNHARTHLELPKALASQVEEHPSFRELPEGRKRKLVLFVAALHFGPGTVSSPLLTGYCRDALALCHAERVPVFLVRYPVSGDYLNVVRDLINWQAWDSEMDALMKPFPEAILLDFQELFAEQPELFFDPNHLNEEGTRRFTKLLKSKIEEHSATGPTRQLSSPVP